MTIFTFIHPCPRPGKEMNTTRNVVSNMTLRPSFEDHGSSLRCVVVHPHWDPAYGNLSCAYDRLNVHFPPKLNCPEKQAIWDSQVRLAATEAETEAGATLEEVAVEAAWEVAEAVANAATAVHYSSEKPVLRH